MGDVRRVHFQGAMEATCLGHGPCWSPIDPVQVCKFLRSPTSCIYSVSPIPSYLLTQCGTFSIWPIRPLFLNSYASLNHSSHTQTLKINFVNEPCYTGDCPLLGFAGKDELSSMTGGFKVMGVRGVWAFRLYKVSFSYSGSNSHEREFINFVQQAIKPIASPQFLNKTLYDIKI